MKGLKILALAAAMAPLFTACIDDDDSNAGFSNLTGGIGYANTTTGYVAFASLGNWQMTQSSGSDWCTPELMSGYGNSFYYIPVKYKLNETGSLRKADFRLADVSTSDVYMTFSLFQYATRGDGSLGNAPLVKSITGDDGSEIVLRYDNMQRPAGLEMTKNGSILHSLSITYAADTTVNVNDGSASALRGKYDIGYQPVELISQTDTIVYVSQTRATSIGNGIIGLEHRKSSGERVTQALLLNDQPYGPDDEHKADSLILVRKSADGITSTEKMKLKFSVNSNRCQSVDVNQLLTGVENCSPYALLSMFRMIRNSFIINEAVTATGTYSVETVLNADKSVRKMSVTDKAGRKVTYTFEYQ